MASSKRQKRQSGSRGKPEQVRSSAGSPDLPGWRVALALFAGFNAVAVPIVGRLAWLGIGALEAEGQRIAAVGLSVAIAAGVMAINVVLIRDATRGAMPRLGQMALWILTGAQFAVTIAAGFFSLLNFVAAVLGV